MLNRNVVHVDLPKLIMPPLKTVLIGNAQS